MLSMTPTTQQELIDDMSSKLGTSLDSYESVVLQIASAGALESIASEQIKNMVDVQPETLVLSTARKTKFVLLVTFLESQIIEGLKSDSDLSLSKMLGTTTSLAAGSLTVGMLPMSSVVLPYPTQLVRLMNYLSVPGTQAVVSAQEQKDIVAEKEEIAQAQKARESTGEEWKVQDESAKQPLLLRQHIRATEPTFLPRLRAHAILHGILSVISRGENARTKILVCIREPDIYGEVRRLADDHRHRFAEHGWLWRRVIWHGPEAWDKAEGTPYGAAAFAKSLQRVYQSLRADFKLPPLSGAKVSDSRIPIKKGALGYTPIEQFRTPPTLPAPPPTEEAEATGPPPPIPDPRLLFSLPPKQLKPGSWLVLMDANFIIQAACRKPTETEHIGVGERFEHFVDHIIPGLVRGLQAQVHQGVSLYVVVSEVIEAEVLLDVEKARVAAWDLQPATAEAHQRLQEYEDLHPDAEKGYGRMAYGRLIAALEEAEGINIKRITPTAYEAIAGRHREGLLDQLQEALVDVIDKVALPAESSAETSAKESAWTLAQALHLLRTDVQKQIAKADRDLQPLRGRLREWTTARFEMWANAPPEVLRLGQLLSEVAKRDTLVRVPASNDMTLIMGLRTAVQEIRKGDKLAFGIFLTLDASCAQLASTVAPGIVTAPSLLQHDATYGKNKAFGGTADTTDLGLLNVTRTGYKLPCPTVESVSATLANIFAIAAHQLHAAE